MAIYFQVDLVKEFSQNNIYSHEDVPHFSGLDSTFVFRDHVQGKLLVCIRQSYNQPLLVLQALLNL